MRVLITGGCGFIGSHLAEYYASRAEVRVLDNLRTGSLSNIEGLAVDFIRGSILDPDVLIQAMDGVDYVFHLAALVSVPESVEHPQECVDLNTKGTLNVLQAAVSAGAKKMCYSSSSAIYGNAKELPKHESMVPAPTSPYAVTKLSGEYYCQIASTQRGLPTASLRYFNVFGPRQDPDSPYAAAIPAFVSRAVNGDDVLIHGDGEQTRDFVYVKDVVAANVHCAETAGADGVFNVGCGVATAINTLAELVVAETGSSSRIVHGPERPGDVKHSVASIERLRGTGYTPAYDFETGLKATVAHFAEPKQ